jgi:transposase
MLSLPPSVRIFLCLEPADMRRSFDGLCLLSEKIVRENPFSGRLFVFTNKRKDRLKALYWDRDGFAIWCKRLEEGAFGFEEGGSGGFEIDAFRLSLILGGIDLGRVRQRRRYSRRVDP